MTDVYTPYVKGDSVPLSETNPLPQPQIYSPQDRASTLFPRFTNCGPIRGRTARISE